MSKFTYKTKDGQQTGFIPGVGAIVDGEITSDTPIENPNLMIVRDQTGEAPVVPEPAAVVPPAPVVGTASQQNPNQPATADQPAANTGVQA